jgi:hypothetical protein
VDSWAGAGDSKEMVREVIEKLMERSNMSGRCRRE